MAGRPIRMSVTLAGGASLGAYHAGVMAALLTAVESIRDRDRSAIEFESFGGASAGALVATIAAAAHARGLDPVRTLHDAWVERVGFDLLTDGPANAPLSPERLHAELREVISADPAREPSPHRPVVVHVALTGLRGLRYRTDGLRGTDSIVASTYADWFDRVVRPGVEPRELFEPEHGSLVDAALASAANPGAFPAAALDRTEDRARYHDNGIVDFPDDGVLWFTDGAMLQVEPIGRMLESARRLLDGSGGGRRVVLLVDARSEGPATGQRFGDPERRPGWLTALARALDIITAQPLYAEIRRIGRDNERLGRLDRVASLIEYRMSPEDLDSWRDLASEFGLDPAVDDPVRGVLTFAAGLKDEQPVDVDLLSPAMLVEASDAEHHGDLLAGDIMGDLGGFLDESLRESDFVLGYATGAAWVPDGLVALGVPGDLCRIASEAVERASSTDWRSVNRGRVARSDLPASSRMEIVRLWGRAVKAITGELFSS